MANKRENILGAVKTALETIDGTGSFETTVNTVELGVTDLNTKRGGQVPFFEVFGGPEDNEPWQMATQIKAEMEVHVIGINKVATNTNKETEANKLIADVKRAIYADRQLGLGNTYVMDSYVKTATPIEAEQMTTVIVAMTIIVRYIHTTAADNI